MEKNSQDQIAVFGRESSDLANVLIANGAFAKSCDPETPWDGPLPKLAIVTEPSLAPPLPRSVRVAFVPLDLVPDPFDPNGRQEGIGRKFPPKSYTVASSATFYDVKRWGDLSTSVPFWKSGLPDGLPVRAAVGEPYALVDFPAAAKCSAETQTETVVLAEEARPYSDREYYVLRCHDALRGKTMFSVPNEAKSDPSFASTLSVTEKSAVYLAVDEEAETPGWVFEEWRRLEWTIEIVEHKRRYRKFRVFFRLAEPGEKIESGPAVEKTELMHFLIAESPSTRPEDPLESSLREAAEIVADHFESLGLRALISGPTTDPKRDWKTFAKTWLEALSGAEHVHVGVPQRSQFLWSILAEKPTTTSWEIAFQAGRPKADPYLGLSPSGAVGRSQAADWTKKWSPRSSFSSVLDPIAIALRSGGRSFYEDSRTEARDRAVKEVLFDGGAVLTAKMLKAAAMSRERQ